MEQNKGQSLTRFRLKKEITLGDMLTPMAILFSAFGVWYTWFHDANLERRQYADHIRHSASVVTSEIERWAPLADRYFEDIQPTIVDVSEMVETTHQSGPANRRLFKGLVQAQAAASQRIVDEQLEVAYIDLYGYVPSLQKSFDTTIQEIKKAETISQDETSSALQAKLHDNKILKLKSSILICNELRASVEYQRQKLESRIDNIATPLRKKMLNLISLSDEDILDEKKREATMQDAPVSTARNGQ